MMVKSISAPHWWPKGRFIQFSIVTLFQGNPTSNNVGYYITMWDESKARDIILSDFASSCDAPYPSIPIWPCVPWRSNYPSINIINVNFTLPDIPSYEGLRFELRDYGLPSNNYHLLMCFETSLPRSIDSPSTSSISTNMITIIILSICIFVMVGAFVWLWVKKRRVSGKFNLMFCFADETHIPYDRRNQ